MSTITSLAFDITSHWDGAGVRDARTDLERLQADVDRLNNESVNIRASADTTAARRDLDSLERNAQVTIRATADTTAAKAQLDSATKDRKAALKAVADVVAAKAALDNTAKDRNASIKAAVDDVAQKKAEAILKDLARLRSAKVNVDLQGDASAKARLDQLTRQKTIDLKAVLDSASADAKIAILARPVDKKILIDVDKSKIDSFKASLDKLNQSGLGAAATLGSKLSAAFIGLGPIALGAGAALTGLAGAITSGFGTAAAALVPFAASIFGTVKSSTALNQALDPLNQKLQVQQQQLAGMQAPSANYTAQQNQMKQATAAHGQSVAQANLQLAQMKQQLTTLNPKSAQHAALQKQIAAATAANGVSSAKYNVQLAQQKAHLATLTPGSSAYNSQLKAINQTQLTINATMANYTPIQQQVAQGMSSLGDAWKNFQQQAEKLTGPILVGGFQLLTTILPKVMPLVAAVAPLFQHIVDQANKFAKGTGFDKWVHFLVNTGVPNLKNIMATVGHLFVALGQIIVAFAPNGLGFTKWLSDITKRMDNWGAGGGFKRFADQIRKDWPYIKSVLESVGTAIINVIKALNGFAGIDLAALGIVAKLLSKLSPGEIQALAVGFIALKLAMVGAGAILGMAAAFEKLGMAFRVIRDTIQGLRGGLMLIEVAAGTEGVGATLAAGGTALWAGALDALALAAAAAGISMSLLVGIIALAVVAVVAVGFGIYELVVHWKQVWGEIKRIAVDVWHWLEDNWKLLAEFFVGIMTLGIGAVIIRHWSAIWTEVKRIAEDIWGFLRGKWGWFIAAFAGPIGIWIALAAHWQQVWGAIKLVATTIWDFLKNAWHVWTAIFNSAPFAAFKAEWEIIWGTVKAVAIASWDALKIAWNLLWTVMKAVWTAFSSIFAAAWNVVWTMIKTEAMTAWDLIKVAWTTFIALIKAAYVLFRDFFTGDWGKLWQDVKNIVTPIWDGLKAVWQILWNAFKTIFDAFAGLFKTTWNALWTLAKTTAQAVWDAMKAAWQVFLNAVKSIWDTVSNALKSAWNTIWTALKSAAQTIWDAMKTAWQAFLNAVQSIWGTVSSAVKSSWDILWNAVKTTATTIWDSLKTAWSAVKDSVLGTLQYLVDNAKRIWNTIVDIFKHPVNLVIGVWDAVAGVFGLPNVKQLADGGHVQGPGSSTSDSIPAMLSDGEFVINAKAVAHYGVNQMHALNQMSDPVHRAHGGPVYLAGGGTPGNPGGIGTTAPGGGVPGTPVSAGGNPHNTFLGPVPALIAKGMAALAHVAATVAYDVAKPVLDGIVNAIPHPMPGVTGPVNMVPYDAGKKVEDGVLSIFKAKQAAAVAAAAAGGGSGQIPSGQHLAIIDAAMKAAGVPPPNTKGQWEAGMNTIIVRESSWNSSAVNRTDINAQQGHPSSGLAQVIAPTFQQYHAPGTSSNIFDPVANVAAAIRYIVARYGGITNVQQANPNAPSKGYSSGTTNALAGWHWVGESGPELANFGRGGGTVKSFDQIIQAIVSTASGNTLDPEALKQAILDALTQAGAGGDFNLTMPVSVDASGANVDENALVQKMVSTLIPQLQMMVQKGTGTMRG